jgi:hypothetical protein
VNSSRKPVDQDHHDDGSGWYAKMRAWADQHTWVGQNRPHWLDQLTPAEKQQSEAEEKWAARAYTEDLPGPVRIGVFVD